MGAAMVAMTCPDYAYLLTLVIASAFGLAVGWFVGDE